MSACNISASPSSIIGVSIAAQTNILGGENVENTDNQAVKSKKSSKKLISKLHVYCGMHLVCSLDSCSLRSNSQQQIYVVYHRNGHIVVYPMVPARYYGGP